MGLNVRNFSVGLALAFAGLVGGACWLVWPSSPPLLVFGAPLAAALLQGWAGWRFSGANTVAAAASGLDLDRPQSRLSSRAAGGKAGRAARVGGRRR